MKHSKLETHVKALQAVTIICQGSGCERPATHLFSSGTVAAYCKFHAKAEADRIGIDLSMAGVNFQAQPTQLKSYRLRASRIGCD